jgi:hypothetical protein
MAGAIHTLKPTLRELQILWGQPIRKRTRIAIGR